MHPARWKLTLIACAAASAAAQAQVAAPPDAGAASTASAAEEAETPERSWRLPPLRISGTLSYDMRATRTGDGSSIGHVLSGTVSSSTYLYAPWLATVSGTLGLSTSTTHDSSSSPAAPFQDSEAHDRLRTRENFVTGNLRLDLFPRSRFPSEIHFDRQDSRTDTSLASPIAFQRQGFGGSVRYRPESGLYNLSSTYEHRTQSGIGFRSKEDSLAADFNTHWKANELSLGGSFNRALTEGFDDESRFTSLVAHHSYTPSTVLSVSSMANLTRTEQRGLGGSDLQVLQASSVGIYHQERSPLTLTGSVRGLVLRDANRDSGNDAFGATVGANYQVNSNLRLTGSGGAQFTRTDAGHANAFNGSLGASYQGNSREFRSIHYDWFASGNLSASVGDSTTLGSVNDSVLSAQLGHTANRTWRLSPLSSIGLSASQSVSASHARNNRDETDSGLGTSKTLLNSVALSWQQSGDGRQGFARASYSDSMELGGARGRFQLFNFQLSGNFELGYGRSVTADLTYQRSTQRSTDLHTTLDPITGGVLRTRTSGASGEVSFRQNQVFGIPRLRFVSRVKLAQDVLKQPGQLLSIPDRETRLWENRLDWNIGRLTTQLELRLSQIDGRRVDSLWLRVQRNFGD